MSCSPQSPSPHAAFVIEVIESIDEVDVESWDRLVPSDDPFCTHAFLSTLEASGSACAETGWMPAHILVRRKGEHGLVAAAPAYVKDHSYGEYIFDWGWAQASQRAGIPYYPKVVSAVPFTPATGRRFLVGNTDDRAVLEEVLRRGLRHLAHAAKAMSAHVLFCSKQEWTDGQSRFRGKVEGREDSRGDGMVGRITTQYHWHDQGYGDFDGWLASFRSRARKEARRERRAVNDLGAKVHVLRGEQLQPHHWEALAGFYRHTVGKKWSREYLSPAFFSDFQDRLAPIAVGLLAEVDGELVAGALAFQRGKALFGRYWGCRPGFERLHFEICYHRPIELCLEHGWTRFEAGAQGQHKIKRGLLPVEIYSLHWLRHTGLAHAVDRAVAEETAEVRDHHSYLRRHGPQRRDG